MVEQFKDKVALVTGGASGIGRAIALSFASESAKVVIADVVVDDGEETAQMIKVTGGEAIFVKTDVSNPLEVEALINKSVEAYGRLDYGCNNAGVDGDTALAADCTLENWDRTMDVNLKGVWLCMKYEIPQMLKQGGGAIVNTASTVGLVAHSGISHYVASKHGVLGLTKTAALDYAKTGIRINAVCPGITRTKIVERMIIEHPEVFEELTTTTPMGRMCEPEEIANAVVWLCSDASSFITGESLVVDGGLIA